MYSIHNKCYKKKLLVDDKMSLFCQLVQVFEYSQIIPLLADWNEQLMWHSGCYQDILLSTDGKLLKMAHT
jgi:hypothetical protein